MSSAKFFISRQKYEVNPNPRIENIFLPNKKTHFPDTKNKIFENNPVMSKLQKTFLHRVIQFVQFDA